MKVLAAIDNKPSSQAILDALVKMHWHAGSEVVLMTVLPPRFAYGVGDQASVPEVNEIEALAVELHQALPLCEVSFLARHGDASTAILTMSEQIQAELIVVGSNCKNTLDRLLLGSVSQTVLNQARCPVIVAKTPCCLARETSPGFKNVLVPIDNSIYSDAAVKWLVNFNWGQDTRFIITVVVQSDTDLDEVEQSLRKRASDLSRLLNTTNIVIEAAQGQPQESIVQLAKKHYCDLIVMGSHGRSQLKSVIIGSVSQAVSHAAPCAVAIIRGIVADDDSWHRTGVFSKVKAVDFSTLAARGIDGPSRSDMSVGAMPGGM